MTSPQPFGTTFGPLWPALKAAGARVFEWQRPPWVARVAGGTRAALEPRLWPRVVSARLAQIAPGGRTPDLFQTVFFELRTRCNGGCAFCPAAVQSETRPDRLMPFDLYARLIDELVEIGYRRQIAFHVNNDPLIVPGLERYIAHARERLPDAWIRILTNGRALKGARAEGILAAGIDELQVNWYTKDRAAPLPAHVVRFRDEILPRYHPPERVRPGTGPLAEGDRSIFRFGIAVRDEGAILSSRAGHAPNKRRPAPVAAGFCEHPFTQLNITADGRIGQCCSDVYFDQDLGRAGERPLLELWHDARFEAVRRGLLAGDRTVSPLCAQCDFAGVVGEYGRLPARTAALALRVLRRLEAG